MENYSLAPVSVGSRCQLEPVFNYHLQPQPRCEVKLSWSTGPETWDWRAGLVNKPGAIRTVKQDIPTVNNWDHVNPVIDFVFTNCYIFLLQVWRLQLHWGREKLPYWYQIIIYNFNSTYIHYLIHTKGWVSINRWRYFLINLKKNGSRWRNKYKEKDCISFKISKFGASDILIY